VIARRVGLFEKTLNQSHIDRPFVKGLRNRDAEFYDLALHRMTDLAFCHFRDAAALSK
jgi:hypothetical protein